MECLAQSCLRLGLGLGLRLSIGMMVMMHRSGWNRSADRAYTGVGDA
jgi:hypothetical protein